MGWRDIALRSVERTVIASVFPKVGVGHTLPLFYLGAEAAAMASLMLALLTSLSLDFIARLSIGGTHLTYSYLKQFAVLPPSTFTADNLAFVTPRVLELIPIPATLCARGPKILAIPGHPSPGRSNGARSFVPN
jgi:hypothetical protein